MSDLDKVSIRLKEGIQYPFLIDFLNEPSKLIRSQLAILYLRVGGKILNDSIYKVLEAGELMHNASLLHDDVIDDAETRRGYTTIGKKYSYKLSIIAGDYLVSEVIFRVLSLNNIEIIKIFQNYLKLMCEGEINQFFLRGSLPTKDDYINICKAKTGALFSAILESCAILTNMDVEHAKNFAQVFGLYFQIKNDLDEASAKVDAKNKIYTANAILGIENTLSLLDNCRKEMKNLLGVFPESIYKQELEGLFRE